MPTLELKKKKKRDFAREGPGEVQGTKPPPLPEAPGFLQL